ncbi:hypothetical protein SEA_PHROSTEDPHLAKE_37 [Gordonia phage PhrostedPhlake]|nr:hypothetical protein SEA_PHROSTEDPHLAKE_37 [Gordonia phage PhrostedPhlake]
MKVGGCSDEQASGGGEGDDREDRVEEHGGWTQPTAGRFPGAYVEGISRSWAGHPGNFNSRPSRSSPPTGSVCMHRQSQSPK